MPEPIRATPPVTRTVTPARSGPAGRAATPGAPSFADVLAARQANGVRFSTHAQHRLATRGIDLAADDLARLHQAVDQASAKGGHESLILLDELALIVSIDNRTVITAMDASNPQGNVFTNVDSVVIAPQRAPV
jgi:flagellar operon protein